MKGVACMSEWNYTTVIQFVAEHAIQNIIKMDKTLGFHENVVD